MFCKKCGKVISEDSKFCSYCGGTVEIEQPEQPLKQEEYPFGSCGRCAKPLEEDDKNGVCKNCSLDLQHEENKLNGEISSQSKGYYVSHPAESRQYDDALENKPNKGHGCLIAFLICVVIGIIFALSIATPHATTVENNVVPSDVQEESSAVLSSALPPSIAAIVNPPEMSLEEYYKIKNGMTYDQVTAIIGSYGVEQARSGSGAYEMIIISWVGNGFLGSNANITFQGGRVEAKGQIGLQ